MKIQITHKLNLREDQNWKVNLHSFYNLLQSLFNETAILKGILGESDNIENILDQIDRLKNALENSQKTRSSLEGLNNFKSYIFKQVDIAVMNAGDLSTLKLSRLEESLVNLERIVKIAEVRTDEFLTLLAHKDEWVGYDTNGLKEKLIEVLLTMAMRSRNRYGIVFNKDEKTENDYFIDIRLPADHEEIELPALFPDVIRDLTANAKKYSPPGSYILCKLENDNSCVRFSIRDNGRGIPEADIPEVVKFGVRGSNVTKEETYGDGFGMTKAYLLTLEHNGKMWIDSVLGEYTEITIEIPYEQ